MFRAPCAHRQEVKIVLYSLWYHHTYRYDDTMSDVLYVTTFSLVGGHPRFCGICCIHFQVRNKEVKDAL